MTRRPYEPDIDYTPHRPRHRTQFLLSLGALVVFGGAYLAGVSPGSPAVHQQTQPRQQEQWREESEAAVLACALKVGVDLQGTIKHARELEAWTRCLDAWLAERGLRWAR